MAALTKSDRQLIQHLTSLSLGADGAVDAAKVAGVLAYLERHPRVPTIKALKVYHRRIARELAQTNAVVEHAGEVSAEMLAALAEALSQKHDRPIAATGMRDDSLIAGLRVRLADDVYESTVTGRLDSLAPRR